MILARDVNLLALHRRFVVMILQILCYCWVELNSYVESVTIDISQISCVLLVPSPQTMLERHFVTKGIPVVEANVMRMRTAGL